MKNRVFKIIIVLMILLTMTMTNFIFVGQSLISYAADGITTNHKNVDFEAYFKNQEGKEVTTLEKPINGEEIFLYLRVNVKKEGYFNGEITLQNSNFMLKEAESSYVSKIENNTIYLNQINVGTAQEIKVKIEPMKEENFSVGLLNMASKISIKGIYRDSTEKDIQIKATRDITLKLAENNTAENVQNEIKIITNKIMEINGQEKRILQFSYLMGLKENNYPMQNIYANIQIPSIDGKTAEIEKIEYLNNMTNLSHQFNGTNLELTLTNEPNQEGKVMWKTQGDEQVIVTCIYDPEVQISNKEISVNEKITLYNKKEIEAENKITLGEEEIDSVLEIYANNTEPMIYKGKLKAGVDREYQSVTELRINFAKAIQEIELTEENSQYIVEEEPQEANVIYQNTTVKKEQFDKIFGQEGMITIYNQDKEIIDTITNKTPADANGNIVISYGEEIVKTLNIETTAPVKEGTLELYHHKTICAEENKEKIELASQLKNTITANGKSIETIVQLEDSTAEAVLEVNKESLSTVVGNNVEIKAILVSNHEKYDLYKSPEIKIQLPEQVENIKINSIDLLYEDQLKIKDYAIEGKTISVILEGEQTKYKEETIQGAMMIINAKIDVDRKAVTTDTEIQMVYKNEGTEAGTSAPIKIVAPTDLTTIYNVQDLGIETIGQEEDKQILIQRGTEEKQIQAQMEIINNKQETIQNVKILGDFPTNHNDNNMGINIIEGINLQGVENAKVYYSENANATDELENAENGWTESIKDGNKVSKYLITLEKQEVGSSIQGTFTYAIPANLEYNQTAETEYQVKYTSSDTQVENEMASTNIEMQTGIGPKIETKLIATLGGKEINAPVRNGEIIKYRIEVSNTGTEDVENIEVMGQVPEGTTMVIPDENYEYTGASYYQELEDRTYETMIENLKVGEVEYIDYEVRVNSDVEEGTTLSSKTQIKYGDVTKYSEEVKNITAKGNIRVSVKRVTDRNVELTDHEVVQYFAIIENISGQKQENVEVQTNLPENLQVETLTLFTGMEKEDYIPGTEEGKEESIEEVQTPARDQQENIKSQILTYEKEVNIGTLEVGETKVLSYDMIIKKISKGNNEINFSVTVKNKEEEYTSNNWEDHVQSVEVSLSMTADKQEENLQAGDVIQYTIVLENKTDSAIVNTVRVKDVIPTQLTVHQVEQDGEIIEETQGNYISLPIAIEGNETSTIKVDAVVDYSETRDQAEIITNVAYAEMDGEKIATTSEVSHILGANQNDETEEPGEENNEENNGDKEDEENKGTVNEKDVANGSHIITGSAWFDENANGQKEQGEKLLSNITVRLLNAQTNNFVKDEEGEVLQVTTNEKGIYVFDKIKNGNYIAIFDYDDSLYTLTKYKVDGIAESENSDAILSELNIENEKQEVAATDLLNIQDNNISGVNIGFVKLENFDLKLDKYVNKILIQNAKGTTVKEYNNETLAKVELDAKTINGSTVIVEYQIKVTNQGEVDGYAKKIADYAPSDLKFSSELNKDWYQVGDTLYTTSLANEKIKAGEAKILTLTLTKTMTESNTGLIPNTAEITEDYNELGITDSNSTPGNRAKGENDQGAAEVMLSIKTGGIVYVSIGIVVVALLGVIVVIMLKKKQENE